MKIDILRGQIELLRTENAQKLITMIEAVVAGGTAIRNVVSQGDAKISTKDGRLATKGEVEQRTSDNYLTEADLASHQAIMKVLAHSEVTVITEELQLEPPYPETCIYVDDLDGTGEFIAGRPGYMVLSMYVENNRPILTANYNPTTGYIYHAVAGLGSYVTKVENEEIVVERIDFTTHISENLPRVLLNGRDSRRNEWAGYYQKMKTIFPDLIAELATGSRVAAILNGEVDVVVNAGSETLKPWDLGMLLNLTEAGGYACRLNGDSIIVGNTINDIVFGRSIDIVERVRRTTLECLEG